MQNMIIIKTHESKYAYINPDINISPLFTVSPTFTTGVPLCAIIFVIIPPFFAIIIVRR